jgi:hypothetical protein
MLAPFGLLIARWLTAGPEHLTAPLLAFIGHPSYGPDALRTDLDRFTFFLGGNDGEFLLGEDPDLPVPGAIMVAWRSPPLISLSSRAQPPQPTSACGCRQAG